MNMDRKKFFDSIRPLFGKLQLQQVSGMEIIFDTWERSYRERTPKTQLAYCLGTTYLETAATMQPIAEYGNAAYFTRLYDIQGTRPALARRMGNVNPGDGIKYRGRGDVQITWKNNYAYATNALWRLGIMVDLVSNPDQAMQPEIAAVILFEGMEAGWFTTKDLDDYIDDKVDGDEHGDYLRARRIINGTDKAEQVAKYSDKFLAALTAAGL